jgi:hypothetical protein
VIRRSVGAGDGGVAGEESAGRKLVKGGRRDKHQPEDGLEVVVWSSPVGISRRPDPCRGRLKLSRGIVGCRVTSVGKKGDGDVHGGWRQGVRVAGRMQKGGGGLAVAVRRRGVKGGQGGRCFRWPSLQRRRRWSPAREKKIVPVVGSVAPAKGAGRLTQGRRRRWISGVCRL